MANGYLKVILYRNRKHFNKLVHRLVAEAFIPNPNNLPQVNHKNEDGEKTNDHFKNLEWSTVQENMKHALLNGFIGRGSNRYNSKLKEQDVVKIRSLFEKGEKQNKLAKMFGISTATMNKICNKTAWTHVT